jgi:phosphatidylglycerol:prolipoprotein diacylglycerol transferase
MIPTIFQLGPFPINSFGLMVALAAIAAVALLAQSFRWNGILPGLAEKFVITGVISGLLGARVWYIVEDWSELEGQRLAALFASAGFTFYGGFIVATCVLVFLCKRHGVSFATFCDSVGPALALGYAIGRLGCQLSGDGDYGIATDSFWRMSYGGGVVPTPPGVEVYPTPFFESAICLLIVWILLKVERLPRLQVRWARFGVYLILIALERFFVEFLRINERIVWGFSEAQVISVGLMVLGAAMLLRVVRGTEQVN